MTQERFTLLLVATSSNVDMLRLEYPASAVQVYAGDSPIQPTIDLKNPPDWLHSLVSQQQQAQWDLEQLHKVCENASINLTDESSESKKPTLKLLEHSNTSTGNPKWTRRPPRSDANGTHEDSKCSPNIHQGGLDRELAEGSGKVQ